MISRYKAMQLLNKGKIYTICKFDRNEIYKNFDGLIRVSCVFSSLEKAHEKLVKYSENDSYYYEIVPTQDFLFGSM